MVKLTVLSETPFVNLELNANITSVFSARGKHSRDFG